MKKKLFISTLFIASAIFLIQSCKLATTPDEDNDIGTQNGIFKISGVVVDSVSGDPLQSAIVKLISSDTTYVVRTDADGSYSTEITINRAIDFSVNASKEGYYSRTVQITATADDDKQMPPFQLRPFFNLPDKSVDPASINLFSQSVESIGVHESGAVESAEIIFEVRDSSGIPLDLDHKSTVYFRILQAPSGAYLYPDSASTNGKGQASVSINSGTVAGIAQIVAEIFHNGNIIRSKPILIAIHGGFPDLSHFDIAIEQVNLPGFEINKYIVTAFVGDKYSNPVREGTSVYFNTTGGIVGGSALTDENGEASVLLTSSNPFPVHETYGPGYGIVSANTIDENGNNIKTDNLFLFAGSAQNISLNPSSFNITNGGSRTFTCTVTDGNNNPLPAGSSITVIIEGKNVALKGTTNIIIPDNIFANTQFTFYVEDNVPDEEELVNIIITIRAVATGRNSTITTEKSFQGTSN